jgi:hypothetical protein
MVSAEGGALMKPEEFAEFDAVMGTLNEIWEKLDEGEKLNDSEIKFIKLVIGELDNGKC